MKLPTATEATRYIEHWVKAELSAMDLVSNANPVVLFQHVAREMSYQLALSIVEKSPNLTEEDETLP